MRCNGCGCEMVKRSCDIWYCPSCGSEKKEMQSHSSGSLSYDLSVMPSKKVDYFRKSNESVSEKLSGKSIYEKYAGGVLEVQIQVSGGVASGSAFLVSSDGVAVTNAHVVTDDGRMSEKIMVNAGGAVVSATLINGTFSAPSGMQGIDLALIRLNRVPSNTPVLKLGNSDLVKPGETVYAIGNALGQGISIVSGIVSDVQRDVGTGCPMIMIDCPINHGNSGGPLFDETGMVIGITTCGQSEEYHVNYAIPSNVISKFIERQRIETFKAEPTTCPKCGSSNADKENGIGYCYDCEKEFGTH